PKKTILGLKNILPSEPYFKGHFPGNPIMPGVLIIEALAQTGAFLLLHDLENRENKLLYFVAVDAARFRRPVVPGDQLHLAVKVLSWRSEFYKMHGEARVGGELAADGTLMCKVVDRAAVASVNKKK
ncbi:MAG TPA: 3-hydroxyacyl-ACP dehydratase FabZ, partial [Candidatus Acidoferrum sp.]|nr:3-hydroxyacyl-ACP dehydratase FabZ [Candidatus Acidoferrum sp.]